MKFIILLSLYISCALALDTIETIPLSSNPNVALGVPTNKNNIPEIIISRNQYVISWNPTKRNLNWVAWKLSISDMGSVPGSSKFVEDKDLKKYLSENMSQVKAVTDKEFKNSCFDRGHQVAAADRHKSKEDEAITYYMSNIIPQTAHLNRTLWVTFETWLRTRVHSGNGQIVIYIIAGTTFDLDFGIIGPNKDIVIPSKNYKIVKIVDTRTNQVIEFYSVIMPNTTSRGTSPVEDRTTLCKDTRYQGDSTEPNKIPTAEEWKKYQAPISEIEEYSGFIFN